MNQGFRMALERGVGAAIYRPKQIRGKESRWSRGQGIATSSISVNSLDHHWINRPKTALKSTVQIVGRSMKRRRASGLCDRTTYGLGWLAHFHGRLAQALTWCLLEPFRVVFRSFRELNHLLSSVCSFGVYDSGPGSYFLDKSSYSHEITKAHGIHQFKPLNFHW